MKLFVNCHECGAKIYLEEKAQVRSELPSLFKVRCNKEYCSLNNFDNLYSLNEVFAESDYVSTKKSALVGGALGFLIAGPMGVVVGGSISSLLASQIQHPDQEEVKKFNESLVICPTT